MPTRRQIELNRATASSWAPYARHRERVTALALAATPAGGRLAVLGAGNCNDVDLAALAERACEVHLVDVDADAVRAAVARQPDPVRARLVVHAPVDISGIFEALERNPRAKNLAERARVPPAIDLGGACDAVLSSCVLSQIFLGIAASVGATNPACIPLVQAVRSGHLRLMVNLLAPGGSGVFVGNLVSSDTAPGILSTPEERLVALLRDLIQQRNFFTGMNPLLMQAALEKDGELAVHVERIRLEAPWLWRLSEVRGYLTYAITFAKRRV